MRRNANFFMVPLNWHHDPDVVDLPPSAQVFWLGLVGLCQSSGNGGVMTWAQVQSFARSFQRGHDAVVRLTARGSLVVTHPTDSGPALEMQRTDRGLAVDMQRTVPGDAVVVIRSAARWLLDKQPSPSISAAQGKGSRATGAQERTRAPAHVKKEREIEREEERTPSGSVRSSSARAVPRSAGGAARPALGAGCWQGATVDDDDPDDDLSNLSLAEKKAAARNAIREGQRKGPATGRDISFSRYDENRPIEPLRSNFKINGGTE